MQSRIIPVEPFELLVVGATGDLAQRKLFAALYHRHKSGQIPPGSRIFGLSRLDHSEASFRAFVADALRRFVEPSSFDQQCVDSFSTLLFYHQADINTATDWQSLGARLNDDPTKVRIFYLAVGPSLFEPASAQIQAAGLSHTNTRLVVEKPVGHDGDSARALNQALGQYFDEQSIYRIDHYLGKETVQNLIVLRFANSLFEPLWNSAHIDHVQITVAENVGVGERIGYYDKSGAMRDMVQNHLLQLLCLVAMEPPATVAPDTVRSEKLKVLHSLAPIDAKTAGDVTVCGQYRAGTINSEAVPGYDEELPDGESQTPTFVAVKAQIDNWRWAGVPFYLRTGKRLAARYSEIIVQFRDVPHSIFTGLEGQIVSNKLVIRVQPDEAVELMLMIKDPGPGGMRVRQVPLDMSFADAFDVRHPDAYERLLMDVVRGNLTLFMRRDEVEAAWDWVDPILQAWEAGNVQPQTYAAGTWGPEAATALIARDGRQWHHIDD